MEQILNTLQGTFTRIVDFLPNLLGALVILIVGWIVAYALRRLTDSALESVGFDNLIQRGKVREKMEQAGRFYDPSQVVSNIVYWAVLITTFLLAANALGLAAISDLLSNLVSFLPLVLVAVIVVAVAVALAQLAFEAIMASVAPRIGDGEILANVTKWAIIAFGIFAALSQLQIAPAIVNTLFIAVIGAIAIAFAISFGVGNVDLAKEITREWYDRTWLQKAAGGSEEKPEERHRPAA